MANEVLRQSVHLVCGLIAALAAFLLPRAVFLWISGTIVLLGVFTFFALSDRFNWLVVLFEREHVAFKGKGVFFFTLGIFLTGLLFWKEAGLALLVLAIPDALATVVGQAIPSPELPYNHRKTYLGSGAFFFTTFLIMLFATSFFGSLLIAFLLTALESFDYREIPFLDDNLVIPLIAATLLAYL